MRCDSGGWLFSGITQEGVAAPDLSRQPSLLLIVNALTGLGICSELAFGLYALTTTGTRGYLDSLEIEQVNKFLDELRKHLKDTKPQFQEIISSSKTFTEQAEILLKEAIQEQLERFSLQ